MTTTTSTSDALSEEQAKALAELAEKEHGSFGEFERARASILNKIPEDASRMTLEEAKELVNSSDSFKEIYDKLSASQPYLDFIGGSGVTKIGVGLLVGGIIFNFTGGKLSSKADEAWEQMLENEKEINKVVDYLNKLTDAANGFYSSLISVEKIYRTHLEKLEKIERYQVNWNAFTSEEKLCVENLVLAVGVLYQMCKVQLVLKASDEQLNQINYVEINREKKNASEFVNAVNN